MFSLQLIMLVLRGEVSVLIAYGKGVENEIAPVRFRDLFLVHSSVYLSLQSAVLVAFNNEPLQHNEDNDQRQNPDGCPNKEFV